MTTLYQISEEILKLLSGGNIQVAKNITWGEVKLSVCEVMNQMLKVEHLSVNEKMQEKIPNGTVIGLYEGVSVSSTTNGRSKATLPVKPVKLPRNMGVWSVYMSDDPENEFIPVQMGQMNISKSNPLLSSLFGQVGYENRGMDLYFNKDLTLLYPNKTVTCELAILDASKYGDYDPLPILPEMIWQIKKEVVALYAGEGIADTLVDPTTKQQQNVPLPQQKQAE